MEREIIVTKAGRKVESIRRSIRLTAAGPSIAYRGRLWPLIGHSIDLAGASFQPDAALRNWKVASPIPRQDAVISRSGF